MFVTRRKFLLPALLAAFVSSCAGAHWMPSSAIEKHFSSEAVLLAVEPIAQETRDSCGLACVTALLEYHDVPLDDAATHRFTAERVDRVGVASGELRDYLRGRGFRAALVRGSLDVTYPTGLLEILRREIPVIVQLSLPSKAGRYSLHYVLVVGFDPRKQWVMVMDPLRGVGAIPYPSFEEYWSRANRLMLIAAKLQPEAAPHTEMR